MTPPLAVDALFWLLGAASVVTAWLVFRTDSMVRAAFWLLAAFLGVGGVLVLLGAEFLGIVLILMMAGEMLIMAIFMVMFMMNPAGLNPMTMVHQHGVAIAGGLVTFGALASLAFVADFPARPVVDASRATAELGTELLGDSMLAFETAGIALLATMVGAVALASRKGRYGDAEEGSVEPAEPGARKEEAR